LFLPFLLAFVGFAPSREAELASIGELQEKTMQSAVDAPPPTAYAICQLWATI
jgi:hypothetical protein